jgi:hypothetical protein
VRGLALGAWQVGVNSALYAVVFVFVCGKVIDLANHRDNKRSPIPVTPIEATGEPDEEHIFEHDDVDSLGPGALPVEDSLVPGRVVS